MSTISRRAFLGASLGSGAAALAAQTPKSAKPNIIIFQVDELRATALRLYHPDGIETPNLARLASAGVLFQNGFTPHPLCMPARASLWTGQYTHTNGCRDNGLPLRDNAVTMADVLHTGGYRTGIFGKNHCFTQSHLARSFDVDYGYPANSPYAVNALTKSLTPEVAAQVKEHYRWIAETLGKPTLSPFPPDIFETHLANQRAMEFIEREGNHPFAALISILDPHPPMQTPEEFARMFPPEKIKMPAFREGEMKTKNTRMQIFDYQIRGSELTETFLRQYLQIYYGMIAFIDREAGRLLDLLDKKGIRDNTIIVFTADHGDYAAEHHLMYKNGSMLDSLVRVPFLVSWPGHLPQGRQTDALVNQVDIMPTLLEICGIPVLHGLDGQRLPLQPGDAQRAFVYSEYGAGGPDYTWEQARALGQPKVVGRYMNTEMPKREAAGHLEMIRTKTHKLTRDSNGDIEFYDLEKDPGELENAHGRPEYRTAEAELRKRLT